MQKVNKAGPSCTVTSEAASSSGLKRKGTACEQGPSAKTKKKTEWYEYVRLNAFNSLFFWKLINLVKYVKNFEGVFKFNFSVYF